MGYDRAIYIAQHAQYSSSDCAGRRLHWQAVATVEKLGVKSTAQGQMTVELGEHTL